MPTIRLSRLAIPILFACICGCVFPEVYELKCSRESSTANWTIQTTLWNLGRAQKEDDDLDVDSLENGLTLLPRDSTVVRVIERVYWEEGDSLNLRYSVIASALPGGFTLSADSMSIERENLHPILLLGTNGSAVGDSNDIVIRWPVDAREIYLKSVVGIEVHPFTKDERRKIIEASRKNHRKTAPTPK